MEINSFGFIRVAAVSPKLKVADCEYNTSEMKKVIERAVQEKVQILCFPELGITGYSCGDLFLQKTLQDNAKESLSELVRFMKEHPSLIIIVGLPLRVKNSLYNVAAVISHEGILGIVPKKYLPNHNEFYEKRWFASGDRLSSYMINIDGQYMAIPPEGMIFCSPFANFGVEICEDLWMPSPPSSALATGGAELIFNLSASNELVGKHAYRKSLVAQQSGRCHAAYIYAAAGPGESSTDTVFSGSCMIAENGAILTESERFSLDSIWAIADIDVEALRYDRLNNTNFEAASLGQALRKSATLNRFQCPRCIANLTPTPLFHRPRIETATWRSI